MNEKICLITGSSRGIGKAAAMSLAHTGAHLILVSKNRAGAEQARTSIIVETRNYNIAIFTADLSDMAQRKKLASKIKTVYPRIDVLINNHTAILEHRQLSNDGIEMNFALNHLAYFHLTHLLLDLLKKSPAARVINVSAEVHRNVGFNFDDPFFEKNYNGIDAYCQAKLGNILFTYELARRLANTRVTVNCLHPGSVDTVARQKARDLWTRLFNVHSSEFPTGITLEESAQTLLHLATSPELEGVTGKYFVDSKETESSPESYDVETAARLWQMSVEMLSV